MSVATSAPLPRGGSFSAFGLLQRKRDAARQFDFEHEGESETAAAHEAALQPDKGSGNAFSKAYREDSRRTRRHEKKFVAERERMKKE